MYIKNVLVINPPKIFCHCFTTLKGGFDCFRHVEITRFLRQPLFIPAPTFVGEGALFTKQVVSPPGERAGFLEYTSVYGKCTVYTYTAHYTGDLRATHTCYFGYGNCFFRGVLLLDKD
jgi:hypothetical protein